MKKLIPKSFFKKIKSTANINRLVAKVYREIVSVSDIESGKKVDVDGNIIITSLPPYFPNVDDVKDDKSRAAMLTEHLMNIEIDVRLPLINCLRNLNNINDNESVKILDELSKSKDKYIIDSEERPYIIASETNLDKVINYYVACPHIIEDASTIKEFYKKNNWKRYEAKNPNKNEDVVKKPEALNNNIVAINNENDHVQTSDTLDLLTIELNNSFMETLRDDVNNADIETLVYEYKGMHMAFVKDKKDDRESFYIVYIPEVEEAMIKGKGNSELLFTLAESYMRLAHYIDINPLTIAYDAAPFKIKGDNMAPMKNNIMLKSWQVKNIELTNVQTAQSLSMKLRPGVEYAGMSQMWNFLESLGNIKDLHGYEVSKISILMEINDGNVDKGYDRLSININKSGANLNMLYPTHRKAYQILLTSNISLGFVAEE